MSPEQGRSPTHGKKCSPSTEVKAEGATRRTHRILRQGVKVLVASFGMWSLGITLALPSVVTHDLSQNNSTLFGTPLALTSTQMDLLSSLMFLGCLVGCWIAAYVCSVLGRRAGMALAAVCHMLGFLGVALLPGTRGILIARFVGGLGSGAVSNSVTAYCLELADKDKRGKLGVIPTLGVLFGQVMIMAAGYFIRYYWASLAAALIPLSLLLGLLWLPESPSFLTVQGRTEEAKAVLLELRGPSGDVEAEMEGYMDINFSKADSDGPLYRELLKPKVLKSLLVATTLFILMFFTGYAVVIANSSRIFQAVGSPVPDNLAALTVIANQMVGGCGGLFLIDKVGRRNSLIISNLVMLLALGSLSIYSAITQNKTIGGREPGHLDTTYFEYAQQDGNIGFSQSKNVTGEHQEVTHIVFSSGEREIIWDGNGDHQSVLSAYGWVPLVCLMVSQGAVALGVNPVPFLLANEYFPTKLRPLAFSTVYNIGTVAGFLVFQLYTPMLESLTKAGLYGTYATVCAIGIPFAMFFVRETKGKAIG